MIWEIWDTKSSNLIEAFETQDEALDLVQDLIDDNDGIEFYLAIGTENAAGHSRLVASGLDLVKLLSDRNRKREF